MCIVLSDMVSWIGSGIELSQDLRNVLFTSLGITPWLELSFFVHGYVKKSFHPM